MKTVLVNPGIIPYEYLELPVSQSEYKVDILYSGTQDEQWKYVQEKYEIIPYSSFEKSNHRYVDYLRENYAYIYNTIVSDYRTMLIAERISFRRGWRSNHNDLMKIDLIIENSINLLLDKRPVFIFFQACPHDLVGWVFGNVAELMRIPVYMCNQSLFPWRSLLLKGVNSEKIIHMKKEDSYDKYIVGYINTLSKKYKDAIPSYEKERLQKRNNKVWSWSTEIKACINNFRCMYFLPFKRLLYLKYTSLAVPADYKKKYIVLFLHFQPERTTLPEGEFFEQQWHVIKTIQMALPDNYYLYVKEHPSIFLYEGFDNRYRNLDFYSNIVSLPRTQLVPLMEDSFALIDNSLCVATVTGTVGSQSLIRGKAVLAFGYAAYRDNKYVYHIENVSDVQRAIEAIEKISNTDILKYMESFYYLDVLSKSKSGIDFDREDCDVDYYSETFRLLGNARCLSSLLLNEIDEK